LELAWLASPSLFRPTRWTQRGIPHVAQSPSAPLPRRHSSSQSRRSQSAGINVAEQWAIKLRHRRAASALASCPACYSALLLSTCRRALWQFSKRGGSNRSNTSCRCNRRPAGGFCSCCARHKSVEAPHMSLPRTRTFRPAARTTTPCRKPTPQGRRTAGRPRPHATDLATPMPPPARRKEPMPTL